MIRSFHSLAARGIRTLVIALAMIALPGAMTAQSRVLKWPEISVTAHLDRDGVLQVQERQTMLFSGDWNGGERVFSVRFGQKFRLESLARIDSISNSPVPLTEGEIDRVDGYDMFSGNTLRWRSRLPDDPLFDYTVRTYELAFTYGQILEPRSDGVYELSHDFSFADREGDIDKFSLRLTLDSVWVPPGDFTGRYETTALAPGNGFVIHLPLQRTSADLPAAVRFGASTSTRNSLLGVLIAGLLLSLLRLIVHEKRMGRFAAVLSKDAITPGWLQQELFIHLPEVAGAAWDDNTSQAEVAATLARLVQEGKLTSRVETRKVLVFSRHVLHLELKTDRTTLRQHERSLIDKLFTSTGTTTDTDRVRKRYERSGFDPAATIRPGIAKLVNAMASGRAPGKVSARFTQALFFLAVVLIALGILREPFDGVAAAGTIIASLVAYAAARIFAAVWRGRITDRVFVGAFGLSVVVTMVYLYGRIMLFENGLRVGPLVLAGLAVWLLALINSVMNAARTQQSAERIAARKRMVAARNFFRDELKKRDPQLSDQWYPYMLAFGLGSHVDRWFKAFGAHVASARGATIATSRMSGVGHSSGGPSSTAVSQGFTGFGGGGGFSGGGVAASFGAAIGGMASSVSPPSSSSSGGGGSSGGGSSGGGGGGGW